MLNIPVLQNNSFLSDVHQGYCPLNLCSFHQHYTIRDVIITHLFEVRAIAERVGTKLAALHSKVGATAEGLKADSATFDSEVRAAPVQRLKAELAMLDSQLSADAELLEAELVMLNSKDKVAKLGACFTQFTKKKKSEHFNSEVRADPVEWLEAELVMLDSKLNTAAEWLEAELVMLKTKDKAAELDDRFTQFRKKKRSGHFRG